MQSNTLISEQFTTTLNNVFLISFLQIKLIEKSKPSNINTEILFPPALLATIRIIGSTMGSTAFLKVLHNSPTVIKATLATSGLIESTSTRQSLINCKWSNAPEYN